MKKLWLLTGLMCALPLLAVDRATAGGGTSDDAAAEATADDADGAGSDARQQGRTRLELRSLLEFAPGEIPESITSDAQGN